MKNGHLVLLFSLACGCGGGATAPDASTSDAGDPLVAQCLDVCARAETAMCRCGGMTAPSPEESCVMNVASARAAGCASELEAAMACFASAPDVCLAFMGSSGPCGAQQMALSTCTSP
ncbi:MAG: hypothetical protein OHK0013_47170 [Sandaracinaceae bacterium]